MISTYWYNNYVFQKDDVNKARATKWEQLQLIFRLTYVQIGDGVVFFYKQVHNRYWLMKVENL